MTEVRRRIDQVTASISDTYAAIEAAGGAVPAAKTSDNLPSTVANALANAGENLDEVLEEQAALISQIATALDGKAAGGGGTGSVETVTCVVRALNPRGGIEGFIICSDGSGSYSRVEEAASVSVMKNSLVFAAAGGNGFHTKGGATTIYADTEMNFVALVTGDCTLEL